MIGNLKENPKVIYAAFSIAFIILFFTIFQKYYFHTDDAFITYTYARNLAAGHGIVYYPSAQPVQGSSSLLYTVLLAGLFRISGIPLDVLGLILSVLLYIVLQGLSIYLIKEILPNKINNWLLNLLLFSFQAPLLVSLGLETMLTCCLLATGVLCILKKWKKGMVMILLLLPLQRLDYLFYFPMFGICVYLIWKEKISKIFYLFFPALATTTMYLVFAKIYFGHWVPHSWIAKMFIPSEVSQVLSWVAYLRKYSLLNVHVFLVLLATGWWVWRKYGDRNNEKKINMTGMGICLAFWLWSVAYTLVLTHKQAPQMGWYLVSTLYFGYLTISIWILREITRRRWFFYAIALVIINIVLSRDISLNYARNTDKRGHNDRREKVGLFLQKHVLDITNKTVLLYEAGKIPFYSGARSVDLLGLVSTESLEGLRKRDTLLTLQKVKPDIVTAVDWPGYFPTSFVGSDYFLENYTKIYQADDYYVWLRNDQLKNVTGIIANHE